MLLICPAIARSRERSETSSVLEVTIQRCFILALLIVYGHQGFLHYPYTMHKETGVQRAINLCQIRHV